MAYSLETAKEIAQDVEQYGLAGTAERRGISETSVRRALGYCTRKPLKEEEESPRPKPKEKKPEASYYLETLEDGREEYVFPQVACLENQDYRIDARLLRTVFKLYTDAGGGLQRVEVARLTSIPVEILDEIRERLHLTHKSIPFPAEDIAGREIGDLVGEAVEDRGYLFHVRFEQELQRKYKEIAEGYARRTTWEDRLVEELGKRTTALPERPPAVRIIPGAAKSGRGAYPRPVHFVPLIADWHVGQVRRASEMIVGLEYGPEVLQQRIDRWLIGLEQFRRVWNGPVADCYAFILGDVCDDPHGETYPNQPRYQHIWGADQIEAAVNRLQDGIVGLYDIFGRVKAKGVLGNHSPEGDDVALRWVADRFRNWKDVLIESDKRFATSVVIGENLFGLHHGRSIHSGKVQRECDVMELLMILMSAQEQFFRRKYVCTGDRHHLQQGGKPYGKEGTEYSWLICPAMMGGDDYGEWRYLATSRPAQLLLIVDEQLGVIGQFSIYLDDEPYMEEQLARAQERGKG